MNDKATAMEKEKVRDSNEYNLQTLYLFNQKYK